MSYQSTTADLKAAFNTARQHLNKGGCFIFDVWYAPAVLATLPEIRIKKMHDEAIEVTRIAAPVVHPNECWVDVNYTVFIRDKNSKRVETLEESHRMHYLNKTEIELLAELTGFKITTAEEWMTGLEPSNNTWGVCFVLHALD